MRLGEANYAVIRIILISLGIAAFISVVSTTYSIFQANSPEVFNNCITKPVIFSTDDSHISSKDEALEFLKGHADGEFTFLQNSIDVCNSLSTGYVYNSIDESVNIANDSVNNAADRDVSNSVNNASYVVCEDGVIYKYESICVEGTKTQSLVSMFVKNKSEE